MRSLPFYQSSTWPRQSNEIPVLATSSQVALSTPKHFINTLTFKHISPPATPSANPVVLLHGYGAGLGFYFRNFLTLGQWVAQTGAPLYALDWLGMGRSARVPFKVKVKRDDIPARVHAAEAFFIDSLEEWRAKMGVEKMTLVGHSLGAYLSVAYALRYPERVGKLVLLSPAGVLGDPEAAQPSREVVDSQKDLTASGPGGQSKVPEVATRDSVEAVREEQKKEKQKESNTRRLFTYLWEEGYSPFQAVRAMSVFGPWLVGRVSCGNIRSLLHLLTFFPQYSSRRFSGLTDEETRNMNDYILNITVAKGSGEYCICKSLPVHLKQLKCLNHSLSAYTCTFCTC